MSYCCSFSCTYMYTTISGLLKMFVDMLIYVHWRMIHILLFILWFTCYDSHFIKWQLTDIYLVSGTFIQSQKSKILLLHHYCSEKFDGIRSDPDQLRAAKLLTQLPVVVISGKGGCGKTTVVTKVMSSCESRPEYVYFTSYQLLKLFNTCIARQRASYFVQNCMHSRWNKCLFLLLSSLRCCG